MGPDQQSIEEILASIRRVITDEEASSGGEAAEDVLELNQPIEATAGARPEAGATRPHVSPYAGLSQPGYAPETAGNGSLVSPIAADASRQALTYLSSLKLKSGEPGDDTLNGLVRELLKPMLKAWLDAELPALVERLVVQEIARLTAGRS